MAKSRDVAGRGGMWSNGRNTIAGHGSRENFDTMDHGKLNSGYICDVANRIKSITYRYRSQWSVENDTNIETIYVCMHVYIYFMLYSVATK